MRAARRPPLPSAAVSVLALALALPGCADRSVPTATAAAARPLRPADGPAQALERGRAVYNFRCYFCHGYSGDAKTLAATYLRPAPRDFTHGVPLAREAIVAAVRGGSAATAMPSFRGTLSDAEIDDVATFVEREFVRDRARNSAYHTAANGWPDHGRYAAAFGFATGAVKLDAAPDTLDAEQQRGRALYLSACVSCHDRGHVNDEGPAWSARPVSYPRAGFEPGQAAVPIDAVSGASAYAQHEIAPRVAGLSARERRGERLFQANCAFCHGADGSGKNWIGQFMEPKARDLRAATPRSMPPLLLRRRIREGLPGTSMPAWGGVLAPGDIDAVAAYVQRALMRADPGGLDPAAAPDAAAPLQPPQARHRIGLQRL